LLNQHVPLDEDRAALAQSLYEFAKQFTLVEALIIMDPHQSRIFEMMRPVFGYLHAQATIRYKRDILDSHPFLDSLKIMSLVCSVTQETVLDAVQLSNGAVMERTLAMHYRTGLLRKTNKDLKDQHLGDTSEYTRLSVLSGGRFKRLTVMQMNVVDAVHYNDNSDHILAPIKVDARQICETLAVGPFAVIAPMDLGGGSRSTLTLDAQGFLAVFLGYKPCASPPDK
jgi:hypothetical protein